jgi:hypothetical protein
MKTPQIVLLITFAVAGTAWIYIVQNLVLLNVFSGLLSGGGLNLNSYLETASNPAFQALWFTCIAVTLIWLATTSRKSPTNSAEVREMRPTWWICATVLVLLGWAYQVLFTVLIWQFSGTSPVDGIEANYFPIPPGGWATLLVFVIFDVGLLFWLPTMFASPRSYRLVVPGALKFLGGR